jgi:hypothetical protein
MRSRSHSVLLRVRDCLAVLQMVQADFVSQWTTVGSSLLLCGRSFAVMDALDSHHHPRLTRSHSRYAYTGPVLTVYISDNALL